MSLLREVEFSDLDGVRALTVVAGWAAPTSRAWQKVWTENPATREGQAPLKRGWVLEHNGEIVGFLSNIPQAYTFGDRLLRAAVATALVVRPDFRGEALKLVIAYVRQEGADLLLNTTAGPETAKIFEYLKFTPLPQSGYQRSLYWVLRNRAFVTSALVKMSSSAVLGAIGGAAIAPVFAVTNRIRGQRPGTTRGPVTIQVRQASGIGLEFDELWRTKSSRLDILWAVRDSATLRWHFGPDTNTHPPTIICAFDDGRLMGYMVVVRQDAPRLRLNRARIADLLVVDDGANTIQQLLGAACDVAKAGGACMLEAVGFPERIQRVYQASRPYQLWNHANPFWYRAADPQLHRTLSDPDRWYACLYDGDGAL